MHQMMFGNTENLRLKQEPQQAVGQGPEHTVQDPKPEQTKDNRVRRFASLAVGSLSR